MSVASHVKGAGGGPGSGAKIGGRIVELGGVGKGMIMFPSRHQDLTVWQEGGGVEVAAERH